MTRLALASDALDLSRTLLGSVPVRVRIASIVQGFLREAFSRDDMVIAIGLQALIAMEKAGTPGDIDGQTIEELRPYIKRNALSKLKPFAKGIGSRVYSLSLAGRAKIPLTLAEEAWGLYSVMLERHPLSGQHNVGAAIKYMANGFTLKLRDTLDKDKTRRDNRQNHQVDVKDEGPDEQLSDLKSWNEIERAFKSEPLLLGPHGEPWAWIYLEGKSGGMSDEQIAEAWNEASLKRGGPGEIQKHNVLSWMKKNTQRVNLLRSLAKRYLDEDLIRRLKLAVEGGGLGRVLLASWERDVITLLV